MDQDQGKKAADKPVSSGASDDVHSVEQAATQMQRLMVGDGSDEVGNCSLIWFSKH